MVEIVMIGLFDEFFVILRLKWWVFGFWFGICMFGFILGLLMIIRVRIIVFLMFFF